MKKITALLLATVVAIGFVAMPTDTEKVAKSKKETNKIILMSEIGPGGGAG